MKTVRTISIITLLLTMLCTVRCSKTDTPAAVALVKLSGKVMYTSPTGTSANAAGAIVYLAKSAVATTTYDQSTIADATGAYTFTNLSAGIYFVNAVFKTDNKNIASRLDGLIFTTLAGAITTVAAVNVTQDLALISVGQSGATIEALAANYAWNGTSAFANTGAWIYDAAHSPIAFEFPYRGQEAEFVGAFSQLSKFVVNFDPANLAGSTIDVEVDVASINTRAPGGRDNRTTVADNPAFNPLTQFTELGCTMGTFNITADNAVPTDLAPQPITLNANRYAKFGSTSIAKYGDGYVAKGNLVFRASTVPIELLFKVVPAWLDVTNNRKYSGFEGKFLMAAKRDFGVTSSSINDALLKIQVSIVLYKQL